MDRRGFIQSFIGAAALVVVPVKKPATLLHDAAHHDISGGLGLAPIKMEGTSIPYDQLDLKPGRIWQSRPEFGKQLSDGLNKAFGEVYEELEPDEWLADDEDEEV